MPCSAEDVAAHVARELAMIEDAGVREALRSRIITPERHLREWDYGAPGEWYPCWTVAPDPESDSAIVYSEHGFGPSHPWGLVLISKPWFGMDSGWFTRLEDAFVDSFLSADLPIWNVIAKGAAAGTAPIEASLTFEEAASRRNELAARDPETVYQVVYRSQREVR